MRKSFRGAVTLASLLVMVGPAVVLAQYPVMQPSPQGGGQVIYPSQLPSQFPQGTNGQLIYPGGQNATVIQQPPVSWPKPTASVDASAQQSIAQPSAQPQAVKPAQQPDPAKAEQAAKELVDRLINKRVDEILKAKAAASPIPSTVGQPPQAAPIASQASQATTAHATPPNLVPLQPDVVSFESSTEEAKVDYQTNGIDLAKIPTTVRITHGGEDLTVQQFGDELKARYGDKLFATDREKYWVGVFGGREFEDKVKHLLATDPQWKVIADRCIIDFKSAAGNEKLAWRWKSIDCDRPQGILVCAPGYDRASPDDACVAVHAQEDLVAFTNVIESPVNVQADTTTTAGSYEGSKRRNKDEPLPFSRVPNRRTIKGWFDQLSALQWLMGFGLPGFLIAGLIFRRQVGMSLKGVAWVVKLVWYGWGFWNKDKAADEPSPSLVVSPPVPQPLAPPPVTTPVVDQQPILCPCPTPTTDEMDQVDRSQDARLNRLEELVHNVLDRIPMQPVVAESARPVKRATTRTRKPAKR